MGNAVSGGEKMGGSGGEIKIRGWKVLGAQRGNRLEKELNKKGDPIREY